jgi:hypothetical protein
MFNKIKKLNFQALPVVQLDTMKSVANVTLITKTRYRLEQKAKSKNHQI